jgi:hypothetical protein
MADFINNGNYRKRIIDRKHDKSYPRVKPNPDKKFVHPETGKLVYKSKYPYAWAKEENSEFYGY